MRYCKMCAAAVILTRCWSVIPISAGRTGFPLLGPLGPCGHETVAKREERVKWRLTNMWKVSTSKMQGSSENGGLVCRKAEW